MLDAILAKKRVEIVERSARLPLDSLLGWCAPSRRGFEASLRRRRPGFVLEVKTASPSAGRLRDAGDLPRVLDSYARRADAISVVTDAPFFGGSLERLAEVRARVDQPLLCKDFVLDPYQVAEARLHGADAVLLILAAIDDAAWRACAALAQRLGMDVLTEVHDEADMGRAAVLGARIVGITNRDLRTMRVDLATTARLAPAAPPSSLVVSESGIASREDVMELRPHAGAFLVGSALMREADVDRAVRRLVFGITKICGLTRTEDARAAIEAGATHGGLVFAPASRRAVTPTRAAEIRAAAPLDWVGVFVDEDPDTIAKIATALDLAAVQLHGDEPPESVDQLRGRLSCEVWKAVRVLGAIPSRASTGADRLLLDAPTPGRGRTFDWSWVEGHEEKCSAVLAGGLAPENVAPAAALGTFGLDVSSGVESSPGRKDPARLRAFLEARR
jgi:indole-3-glycerol phosphate synthase/phosphoribosylanthranilate isomerase